MTSAYGSRAACQGDLLGLEHEEGDTLAHDEPVPVAVERPTGLRRVVVVAVGERADDVERPERERAERHLAPPAIAASIVARPDRAHRLADRDGAGGARVGGREDRPADVEGDPEVGRRRPAEHREREVRGDGLDAPLEVRLVLASA